MFEVGFSELLLIMGLALLVLGPEKLPKVVGEIGRWMGRARSMARQFREQLEIEAQETARRQNPPVASSSESDAAPASEAAPPASNEGGSAVEPSSTDTTAPATTPTPSSVEDYVNRHSDDPPRG